MTCREKLAMDRPDCINHDSLGGCYGCPNSYGYLDRPEFCSFTGGDDMCTRCWDREIPGTENNISNNEKENETMSVTVPVNKMTKAQMLEEIERAHNHIVEMETELKNLEKYKQYEEAADELKAMHTAFMNSGFTNEQAFDLLKMLTQSMVPVALRGMSL